MGCSHDVVQGSMRGFDRELAGKGACAGAPMISSAVVTAADCWRGGEAIVTSPLSLLERCSSGCAATPPHPTKKILQPLLLRLLNARFERPSEALAQRLA